MHEQHRQQRPLPGPPERQRAVSFDHLKRPKDSKLDHQICPAVNSRQDKSIAPSTAPSRTAGIAKTTAPPAVVRVQASASGFDWGDAGIGAAGGLALSMIGLGGVLAASQRRTRRTRHTTGLT